MAIAEFENVLKEHGFTPSSNEPLPAPTLPVTNAFRNPVLTGAKLIDGAKVEVQLQEVRSINGSGWACASRITHPNVQGEAMLRPRVFWGTYRALTSGPKVVVVLLAVLMLSGIGLVMLPGMFLAWLMFRGMLGRLGVTRFDDLVTDGLKSRFLVWGKDHGRARQAFPAPVQEALLATDWFGSGEVRDGALLLDRPAGFGRADLFGAHVASTESAATAIVRGPRAIKP